MTVMVTGVDVEFAVGLWLYQSETITSYRTEKIHTRQTKDIESDEEKLTTESAKTRKEEKMPKHILKKIIKKIIATWCLFLDIVYYTCIFDFVFFPFSLPPPVSLVLVFPRSKSDLSRQCSRGNVNEEKKTTRE